MGQHVKRATNQPLAALVNELGPLFSSMLMFTKMTGKEEREDLLADMEALRGYVMSLGKLISKYDALSRRASILALVSFADRLDAAGASAMADVLDEAALCLSKHAQQTPQQQLAQQQQLADRFVNIHTEMLNATRQFSNPTQISAGMKHLLDQVKELGLAANALKQTVTSAGTPPTPATASVVQELVSLANYLDAEGEYVQADVADRAASIMSRFAEEQEPPIKPGHKSSLSTRYCPDHIGVQAIRIAERVYQCPIDGRTYDYEGGYTNYNGQRVPGGSIAAQTPTSTPYALPQRLFDSRQNILNTIN